MQKESQIFHLRSSFNAISKGSNFGGLAQLPPKYQPKVLNQRITDSRLKVDTGCIRLASRVSLTGQVKFEL